MRVFATMGLAAIGLCTIACSSNETKSAAGDDASSGRSTAVVIQDCTFTFGYWKTHPTAWPVQSLTLGTVSYTEAQLLQILAQPVMGNGLVALAHQLVAAKLNIAQGADASALGTVITQADTLIGSLVVPPIGSGYLSPSSTSALTDQLDNFNSGIIGPGHCGESDAGLPDAPPPSDGGIPDAPTPPPDAGVPDAPMPPRMDGGAPDSAPPPSDAGPPCDAAPPPPPCDGGKVRKDAGTQCDAGADPAT